MNTPPCLPVDTEMFPLLLLHPRPSNPSWEVMNRQEAEPKIIVYCKLGGRATTAATVLSEMGFQNVYCYKGSASEWWSK